MQKNDDYLDELDNNSSDKKEDVNHQKSLISIFLSDLDDIIPINVQERINPKIKILVKCYNRFAVKEGSYIAIEDTDTNAILKERLELVPIEELKPMLFKYSDTVAKVKILTREEVKERFKYRLITSGFILLGVLATLVTIIFLFIHKENPDSADSSIYREVFNSIVEVFRIIADF